MKPGSVKWVRSRKGYPQMTQISQRRKITKRSHAPGLPVQGSEFKVQSFQNYETNPTRNRSLATDETQIRTRGHVRKITKRTQRARENQAVWSPGLTRLRSRSE